MTMHHVLEPNSTALADWLKEQRLPGFRAAQIRRWLFEGRAEDWSEMTDLPKALRADLARSFSIWTGAIRHHSRAEDGTEKLLMEWADGGRIECVLLRDRVRRTICISTQVGCAMGCVFCASGLDGVERNLSSGEIVEQMLRLVRLLPPEERLSHIVVMGMGEPLANLNNLLPALAEASSATGLGISPRRITVSTVGLPKAISRLAEHRPHYRLALSLHAPNDALRNQLVPVNASVGLAALLEEADHYFAVSGRQLTFEYVLLADVNDQPEHARGLARLLAGREALVNVIPYNQVAGLPYRTPTAERQRVFRAILAESGLRVRFRHRKGDQIDAACGQLRRRTAPLAAAADAAS